MRATFLFLPIYLVFCAQPWVHELGQGVFLSYERADVADIQDGLKISLESDRVGWLGIGFGSQMAGSDIIVVSFDGDTPIAEDRWATGQNAPSLDKVQDLQLVLSECYKADNKRKIVFLRKLDTGDGEDFVIELDKEIDLIYAFDTTDQFSFHGTGNHGAIKFDFKSKPYPTDLEAPTQSQTVVAFGEHEFTIDYGFSEDGLSLEMLISFPWKGWFGLGFGSTMSGADIVLGEVVHINHNDYVQIKDTQG